MLVETCQISYITNQILQIISKKQRKREEEIKKEERQICLVQPVKVASR